MLAFIKNTLHEVFQFLKQPKDENKKDKSLTDKLKLLFIVLTIDLLFSLIIMTIISLIKEWGAINLGDHKFEKLLQNPIWLIFLLGVLIIPLVEEFIFRWPLKLKSNYLISILIWISSWTGKNNKKKFKKLIQDKWQHYYTSIFYLSAFLFAFIHLFNFENFRNLILIAPLLIMPQFIMGSLAGYLRIRISFIWGVNLHALHNLIFVSIAILPLLKPIEKLNISTEEYQIKVEESLINSSNKHSFTSKDSIVFQNIKLKSILAQLLDTYKKTINFQHYKNRNHLINLSFKSHSDSLNAKEIILSELQKIYGFSIDKHQEPQVFYELQISDSSRLLKHKTLENEGPYSNISFKEIDIKNGNINYLVETLNREYFLYFSSNITLENTFNFNIEKGDFKMLKAQLKDEYGLSLKQNHQQIELTNIKFPQQKD